MENNSAKAPLEIVADLLNRYRVEFIVIGGQAEMLYGSARVTYDTDLCYRRTQENLRCLAEALRELKPALRGAPADLPFRIDAESLALGCNYTFSTTVGDLDLLGWVEPMGDYEQLAPRAETLRHGELTLRVISLEDLIRVKQHIGRPKDRDSLVHLLAIQRIRRERENTGPSGAN